MLNIFNIIKQAARYNEVEDTDNQAYEDNENQNRGFSEEARKNKFDKDDLQDFVMYAMELGIPTQGLQNDLKQLLRQLNYDIADDRTTYALAYKTVHNHIQQKLKQSIKNAPPVNVPTPGVAQVNEPATPVAPTAPQNEVIPQEKEVLEKAEETVARDDSAEEIVKKEKPKVIQEVDYAGNYQKLMVYRTPQASKFAQDFLPGGKAEEGGFDPNGKDKNTEIGIKFRSSAQNVVSNIRTRAVESGRTPPNISVDDVVGQMTTGVYNALGVQERYEGGTEEGEKGYVLDNRLVLFISSPDLIPANLYPEYKAITEKWKSDLMQEQMLAMSYNKSIGINVGSDIKSAINAVKDYCATNHVEANFNVVTDAKDMMGKAQKWKAHNDNKKAKGEVPVPWGIRTRYNVNRIVAHYVQPSPLAHGLLDYLNEILEQGPTGPKASILLDAITKKAVNSAVYETNYRERDLKAGQFGETSDNEGGKRTVEPNGVIPSSVTRKSNITKSNFADNRESFKTNSQVIASLMDDAWGLAEKGVESPKAYTALEKAKLKMELFKYQAGQLFGDNTPGVTRSRNKISNDMGEVFWAEKKKDMLGINESGDEEVREYNRQMKDIVKSKVVAEYYLKLLELKKSVIGFFQQIPNADIDDPKVLEWVKRNVANTELGKNPILSAFMNDKFIKMTVARGMEDIKETEEDARAKGSKYPAALQDSIGLVWNHFTADAVIAYTKQFNAVEAQKPESLKALELREPKDKNSVEHDRWVRELINYEEENTSKKEQGAAGEEEKKAIPTAYETWTEKKAQVEVAAQNMLAFIYAHGNALREYDPSRERTDKFKAINKKIKTMYGLSYNTRELLQMLAGLRPVPQELKDAVAKGGNKVNTASVIYNQMLSKLSALSDKKNSFLKFANVDGAKIISQNIQNVIKTSLEQIRLIMGN